MVSAQTRNDVWQELLDVARLVRYYEALSDRYRRNHMIVRFLLLAAAVGGIATLLDLLPADRLPAAVQKDQLVAVANALVALLVVWDFVSNYAKKAAVLQAISLECSLLDVEWRKLWADVNDGHVSDAEARGKNHGLGRRISEVTGWAGQAGIRESPRLNKKCTKVAYKVMADRYAA